MPKPKTCQLRRVVPVGPLTLCDDLSCFVECYELTKQEKNEAEVSEIPSNSSMEDSP